MTRKPIHPYWGILEIAVLTMIIFSGIWLIGTMFASSPGMKILFWAFFLGGTIHLLWVSPVLLHRMQPKEWGLKIFGRATDHPGSFKKAWPVYTVFTFVAAAGLTLYTIVFSPESLQKISPEAVAVKFITYLLFAFAQTIIFFGFMLTRIRKIMSVSLKSGHEDLHSISVVLITAIIFSAFHLPNPPLMILTFLAGLCWAWIFYRRPNVLLMCLSHTILGTILHRVVQLHMRIGPFYENPDLYVLREVIPGLKELIGGLF